MPQTTALLDGGIVINEIKNTEGTETVDYDGSGTVNNHDTYVELANVGGSTIDISGWQLIQFIGSTAHVKETFDASTMINPGGHYVIVDGDDDSVAPTNINGDATLADDSFSSFGAGGLFALYDPDENEFIAVSSTNTIPLQSKAMADYFGPSGLNATQIGTTEATGAQSGNSAQRVTDGDTVWAASTQTPGDPNCFAAGTLIATPNGEVAVECLGVGDLVTNADGRDVRVLWLGRQTILKTFWGERAQLVRIAAGALSGGACKHTPHRDLYVTGDHGMVLDGYVVNASALVNGGSIDWVSMADTPEAQTVYHIETEAHDVIVANGAASETYLDMPGRRAFDNFAEYQTLYGAEREIAEDPMPRVSSRRLLPCGIAKRLGIAAVA